ncbi:TPA: hypothetical protein ANIA_10744 [Aspergillus nidulans FGSC A4]|uniref:Uncharacterized protein n=1 Tax=Emericella nidulans (strain FGSC A4 / ATCC 38163 / CBS 112.46 / NRRL 194 / M139) TaxID=227321 RepID=C8V029_EMENI|nr:TPA: hypothetical protein ANIA_10744 [Aspergillus nidulans FGSC A4]
MGRQKLKTQIEISLLDPIQDAYPRL